MLFRCTLATCIGFLLSFNQFVYGQVRKLTDKEINRSTVGKLRFADTIRNCEAVDEWFKKDVKNNTVFLFFTGGIAPVAYADDKNFQNRFNVYFEDFGCVPPDYNCMTRYNWNTFDYLTSLFGKKWQNEIRKDAIGLASWKKHKHNQVN